MEITLPWPPSVNTYWRKWKNRMVISDAGRLYREAVMHQIMHGNPTAHFEGPIVMTVEAFRPDKRKRDLDNLLKAPLDALAHAGIYKDDSQIVDLRVFWGDIVAGMLKVTIKEADENGNK